MWISLVLLFFLGYAIAVVVPKFTRLYAFSKDRVVPSQTFVHVFRVGVGLAFPLLYLWEVKVQAISLGNTISPLRLAAEPLETLHWRFAVHVVFFVFLLAATYIDFEEMIIPDTITVPGTILGLVFAACLPQTLLPATQLLAPEDIMPEAAVYPSDSAALKALTETRLYDVQSVPIHVTSSQPWPKCLNASEKTSLVLAIAIWWFWCLANLNRVWYLRLRFRKAFAIFCRYLVRSRSTYMLFGLGVVGSIVIYRFWSVASLNSDLAPHWRGFVTALVGLFAGMVLIWCTRIIGWLALRQEAMGFGDVTLMGMIGVFVGWQACVLIYFLAPLAGFFLAISRLVMGLGRELPYGPFLCLATGFVILVWPECWNYGEPFFSLGWFVPAGMGVCMVLLGVLLRLVYAVKIRILAARER